MKPGETCPAMAASTRQAIWAVCADCEGMEQGMGEEKMKGEGIWKAAAWLASAAVAVACILKTGNADFLQILAFPFFVCILT